MKINFNNCTEEELWKYVASYLQIKGIDTVLVGGSVVSVYTDGAYQSGDLDLILTSMFVKNLSEVMGEIGFQRRSARHYTHPECKHLFIEFPAGPIEIGSDNNIAPETVEFEGKKIKILSPTDCVKDRLASYLYFNARECFDQALLVAKRHPVNLPKVKKWCKNENREDVFIEFRSKLKSIKN